MCGIVGAIAGRDVVPILIAGLQRLEYRGYDSAGLAVIAEQSLENRRAVGKIAALQACLQTQPVAGHIGIAHTRWATHGAPAVHNAHPQISTDIAVVHNGIIENYQEIKADLQNRGYVFSSETDTEVIAHAIHFAMRAGADFVGACRQVIGSLHGAYSLGVIDKNHPDVIVGARQGSPLCIGLGVEENFLASDVAALLPVTSRFIFLDDGDFAVISRQQIRIEDRNGKPVSREEKLSALSADDIGMGQYAHFMQKEIYEQGKVISETISGRIDNGRFNISSLGKGAQEMLEKVRAVHIVSCGTSYHAASVARYWIEKYAQLPCHVEVASEYRYRHFVVPEGALFITISQSGETADTLAALKHAKEKNYLSYLAICNAPESSLTRESEFVLLTNAGVEKSVASTKAFTTQLAALLMIVDALRADKNPHQFSLAPLVNINELVAATFALEPEIIKIANQIYDKKHALFLGRGALYPVALEGSLKLKEISYIHAEAYPAGELKHGPLALVDASMPVIAVAPDDDLIEKLKSNLQEVKARGGKLYIFADSASGFTDDDNSTIVKMPACPEILDPIIYTIPLQLLAYHSALQLGTDVDQPRNLAKSVTVE